MLHFAVTFAIPCARGKATSARCDVETDAAMRRTSSIRVLYGDRWGGGHCSSGWLVHSWKGSNGGSPGGAPQPKEEPLANHGAVANIMHGPSHVLSHVPKHHATARGPGQVPFS